MLGQHGCALHAPDKIAPCSPSIIPIKLLYTERPLKNNITILFHPYFSCRFYVLFCCQFHVNQIRSLIILNVFLLFAKSLYSNFLTDWLIEPNVSRREFFVYVSCFLSNKIYESQKYNITY